MQHGHVNTNALQHDLLLLFQITKMTSIKTVNIS